MSGLKQQAKDLRKGNRFSYVGAFTVYLIVSVPELSSGVSGAGSVKFKAINVNWDPPDREPIDIRLSWEREVQVFPPSENRQFTARLSVEDHGIEFEIDAGNIPIARLGISRDLKSFSETMRVIVEEELKR